MGQTSWTYVVQQYFLNFVQDIRVMREQVEALDQHVIAVVKDILDSGLIPLVVGEDNKTYIMYVPELFCQILQ